MSKRHQASRRRTYGRRQHEVRERTDRGPETSLESTFDDGSERRPTPGPFGRFGLGVAGPGLVFLGLD